MGMSDAQVVEGYCDRRSYVSGDRVGLHLSVTRPGLLGDVVPGDRPSTVDITVSRIGATREPVWSAAGITVDPQPIPERASALGTAWPVTLSIDVDADWPSGWYDIALRAAGRADDGAPVMHAGFAVRAPAGRPNSPILLVLATNTWNAYNDWGGPNLYTGETQVSFHRPFARGLLDRPDPFAQRNANRAVEPDPNVERWTRYVLDHRICPWSGCAGWPSWEALFVAWAERAGYSIDMATNDDLATVPDLLDDHRLVLSVGHDEYWSAEMRDALEGHVAAGGNAAFLSGNTAFWRVQNDPDTHTMRCPKLQPDADGRTWMWADPRTGRPETQMTGVTFTRGGYARIGNATPRGAGGYTVWRPDHWLFAGTDLRYGDVLGAAEGVVGYECDGCAMTMRDGLPEPTHEDGCPEGFEILATAPAHLWSKTPEHDEYPSGLTVLRDIGELEETADVLFGDHAPETTQRIAHGRAVLGSYVAGGTVVTTGCTDWTFGLAGGDPVVEQITHTLIGRLSGETSAPRE
jgi:hypothetical protein